MTMFLLQDMQSLQFLRYIGCSCRKCLLFVEHIGHVGSMSVTRYSDR